MQTQGRLFDELANLMTTAAGAAQGAAREVETLMRSQLERLVGELDLVTREHFDVVKEMAQAAREENETLKGRIAALEKDLKALKAQAPTPARGRRAAAKAKKAAPVRRRTRL